MRCVVCRYTMSRPSGNYKPFVPGGSSDNHKPLVPGGSSGNHKPFVLSSPQGVSKG
jgi:hypothetical protein